MEDSIMNPHTGDDQGDMAEYWAWMAEVEALAPKPLFPEYQSDNDDDIPW